MSSRRFTLILLICSAVALAPAATSSTAAPATGAGARTETASQAPGGPRTGLALLAEPQAGSAPFLKLISGARSSIDLTMYELYDRQVEAALASAAHRGVDVRVLLNGGYYSERDSSNDAAYAYLTARHVHVRYTPTYFALTHQKTLTVDGRGSAIMTLNFDGLYSSTRDFAILDRQPADVAAITSVFNADWNARSIQPSSGTGDLVWSPGAETRVLALISSARSSIDLENEEMDYPPATDALCGAAHRGVTVEIVMTYASDWRAAFDQLAGCGVHIRLYHGQSYYIHAKLLEVDDRQALVSSQNLSTTSLRYNRELGIDVSVPAVLGALRSDFAGDYAGAEAWSG
jgi:cardiolipin synthase